MNARKLVAILILTFFLTTVYASLASPISDKKEELSQVKENIDSLNLKMERAVEEYNQSENDLGQVKKQLTANRLRLEDAKIELKFRLEKLSERVSQVYRQGPMYSLNLIINSNSLRELIENIYYISLVLKSDNLLADRLATAKEKLKNIDTRLNNQKVDQEILVNKVAAKKIEIEDALASKNRLLRSVAKDLVRLQAEERERIKRIREEALKKLAQNKIVTSDYSGANPSGNQAVEIAKKYLGVRYTWGGTSPQTGFDCSGFVWYVYRQVGVYLPRTSRQQYNYLSSEGRLVNESNLRPGDLVFYGQGYVSDVKMYMGSGYIIGANGGQFIPGEVKILPLNYRSDYYAAGRP